MSEGLQLFFTIAACFSISTWAGVVVLHQRLDRLLKQLNLEDHQ